MSIINDALKKVSEENKKREEPEGKGADHANYDGSEQKNRTQDAQKKPTVDNTRKKKLMPILSVVFIAAIISYAVYFVVTNRPDKKQLPETKPVSENKAVSVNDKAPDLNSPVQPETVIPPALSLNGIVFDNTKPYTIINNAILMEGDAVEGATIIKIQKESVTYSFKGKEFELRSK